MTDKEKYIPDGDDQDLEPDIDEETDIDTDEKDEDEDSDSDSDNKDELTPEQKIAKAEARANKFQRLFQKARQHSKDSKPEKKVENQPTQTSVVDTDERILLANGMDKALLSQLKDIAKLRGVSLLDARDDELFVAAKDIYEKKQTAKKAAMGVSKGSGGGKQKQTTSTPGLSRDAHKAMFDEAS